MKNHKCWKHFIKNSKKDSYVRLNRYSFFSPNPSIYASISQFEPLGKKACWHHLKGLDVLNTNAFFPEIKTQIFSLSKYVLEFANA